jgi:alkaline phosphatase D
MFRRVVSAAVVAVILVPGMSRGAGLDPCTNAIAKAVETYAKKEQSTIAKCEDQRSNGKLAPTVNCRPADGPVTDAKTASTLAKAVAKVQSDIGKKCSTPLPPLGPACDSATTVAELAACITAPAQDADVEAINVDTLIATVYGDQTQAPITDSGLQKCQATISKEGGKYLGARMAAIRSCQAKRAGGKVAACPDAATGKKLDKLRATFDKNIRKKCTDAQLAPDTAPKLDFGNRCASYKVLTFKRDGATNNNSVSVLDRAIACLADAHAGAADRTAAIGLPGDEKSAFTDGVAAGDATDTAAIFWTRLPDPNSPGTLEYTTDATFKTGVLSTPVSSVANGDGTAKMEVTSLNPHTVYFYRFKQAAATSPVGRVVTAPSPSDNTTPVRLGWSGDSNAFNRPFTSLDPVRLQNPDAWMYIGDTIYGDDPQSDGLNAQTIPEYESKYRVNRSDAPLRGILAAMGTYAMSDDHEVQNDYSGAEPAFATRMAAGNFSFRRYFPIREDAVDPMRVYRNFQWGSGAEFFLIDYRQYKSAKYTCCNDATKSGFVTTATDSTCPGGGAGEALLPSAACTTAMAGANRTVLGSAQKQWLKNGLLNSTASFKFIMNGPPITQLEFLPYDRWEAYPAERNEVLDFILNNNIKNVIWLSTDFHALIISGSRVDVTPTHEIPEIISGSIGEATIFEELPASIIPVLPTLPALLTQITEYDIDRYNVVLMTVTPGSPASAKFDFYDRTGAVIHSTTYTATP